VRLLIPRRSPSPPVRSACNPQTFRDAALEIAKHRSEESADTCAERKKKREKGSSPKSPRSGHFTAGDFINNLRNARELPQVAFNF